MEMIETLLLMSGIAKINALTNDAAGVFDSSGQNINSSICNVTNYYLTNSRISN